MAIKEIARDVLEDILPTLQGWTLKADGKALVRTYKFKDFKTAFAFMTQVALLADKMDHHPDWSNSYNRLEIVLTTHAIGAISERDVKMAKAINRISSK